MTNALETRLAELKKNIESNISQKWFRERILKETEPQASMFLDVASIKDEVSKILTFLDKVSSEFEHKVAIRAVGTVQYIGNGVANISGLPQAGINELVKFPTGVQGLVLNLDADSIDVILLGTEEGIHGGDLVTSTQERITVPVGPDMIGRVLNPLAVPLDDQPPFRAVDYHYVDIIAPGIIERAPVSEPMHTGIKTIDALFPIGRGQRELIIGDRQTGKTSLAVDTILAQKDGNVICIYVSIGQKKSSVLSVVDTLKAHNAFEYTAVISSNPDDPPALRYLAPFTGCTLAEFFLNQGQDVLIIYDDLSKHADAYRELSLLLRRPPGREAYPGDIFYLHSRLLERACKLNEKYGGGSLTALPIMTMQ
ncbi:MAG: F0F1 ATP synthase subunit alpha, partial [Chloroflexi bacterium]|nr:F0F1 ATP synthase subunit alpha [Chloroflexota bacterium]